MKKLIFLAALSPSLCFAQSVPHMDRRVTLQGPTGLNWAMSLKADTSGGILNNPKESNGAYAAPSITGGTSTNQTINTPSISSGTAIGLEVSSAIGTVFGASVSRYLKAKLLDVISVKDFGAKGDGATDDAAAINSAIAYAKSTSYSGGRIWFPDGIYNISAPIVLTGSGFSLVGSSPKAVTIRATFTSGNIIQVGQSPSSLDNENDGIYGINITGLAKMTSGAAVYADGVYNLRVDNIRIAGFVYDGIQVENSATATYGIFLSKLWIAGIQNHGISIGLNTTDTAHVVTDVFLSDSMILPGQSQADCGICLYGAGGFYAAGVDITNQGTSRFNNAIKIDPPGGTDVNAVMLSRVLADSSNNENILFSGAGTIADVTITNGWANTSLNASGISFENAQTDGVTIAATAVDSNAQYGIVLDKGVNVGISDSRILNNSMSGSGKYDGIGVGAGVSAFSITNNQIGNGGWFNVSGHSDIHQRWAVNISASAGGGFVVSNNRGFNNTQGMVNDQTASHNKSIIGNVNG